MNFLSKYTLQITALITGGVIMVLEIVGSRVLAPNLGSSTFIWTSLIGVVMASLSLGYYLGGVLADKRADHKILSLILLISGMLILATNIFKASILQLFTTLNLDVRWTALFASLLIFAPASTFMGMVTPYLVKLNLKNLDNSGQTVGNLYAISTAGSIIGTFLTGYYLLAAFGTTNILFLLSVIMVLLSLMVSVKERLALRIVILLTIIFAAVFSTQWSKAIAKNNYIDEDTQYSRVIIHERSWGKRPTRMLTQNGTLSSAIYLDGDDYVFNYNRYFNLAPALNPEFENTLMLGGAAYTYPTGFLAEFPHARIDVVEIDPKITEYAKKYFGLEESPRIRIFHEDARVFLNKNKTKYDIIFVDAFGDLHTIPFHIITQESIQKMKDSLNENGIVAINIISSLEGKREDMIRAAYNTFKSVFTEVYVYKVYENTPVTIAQNLILIASNKPLNLDANTYESPISDYMKTRWNKGIERRDSYILTDDYAPIEHLVHYTNR